MGLFSTPKLASGDLIEVAGAPVRLKVNARARRVSLRVDATRKREVVATAPPPAAWARPSPSPASAPPGSPSNWAPCRASEPLSLATWWRCSGELGPSAGAGPHAGWRPGFARRYAAGPPVLAAFGEGDAFGRAAVRLLRRQALEVLSRAHSATTPRRWADRSHRSSVGDARARWGSCRPPRTGARADAGSIRYSWRLVLAPYWVADYVAAHECAHLVEANHGPRFWALVHEIYGSEKTARDWLKRHGARLHGFGR